MLGKRAKAGDTSKAKKKWQEEIEDDGSDSLHSDDDLNKIPTLEEDDIEYKKRRKLEEDR
jgi:hypothetical protein